MKGICNPEKRERKGNAPVCGGLRGVRAAVSPFIGESPMTPELVVMIIASNRITAAHKMNRR